MQAEFTEVNSQGGEIRAHFGFIPARIAYLSALHPDSTAVPTPPDKRQRPRVLLVEDDPTTLAIFSRLLDVNRIELVVANNGADALAAYVDKPADLLITDIDLPGLDGFGLVAAIEAACGAPPAKLIFVSGHNHAATLKRARELGAWDFLVKPFHGRALLESVREALFDPPPP